MPYSLTYVSRSRLHDDGAEHKVAAIVEVSRRYNQDKGLTGALIFTGRDFAQTLEGDREAIDFVMDRILNDDRHRDVAIIHASEQSARDFADWTLVYRGLTTFVQRHVDAVRSAVPGDHRVAVIELRALLRAFAQEASF